MLTYQSGCNQAIQMNFLVGSLKYDVCGYKKPGSNKNTLVTGLSWVV